MRLYVAKNATPTELSQYYAYYSRNAENQLNVKSAMGEDAGFYFRLIDVPAGFNFELASKSNSYHFSTFLYLTSTNWISFSDALTVTPGKVVAPGILKVSHDNPPNSDKTITFVVLPWSDRYDLITPPYEDSRGTKP
ncbi:hypothetical protein [Pseudomonas sichuanensis]|uniref:Uncharacterized protein n=1 Tax=Pseudomonas sichuanensis TaxID=2213015 RepID=A0ABV0DC42_9PSED